MFAVNKGVWMIGLQSSHLKLKNVMPVTIIGFNRFLGWGGGKQN